MRKVCSSECNSNLGTTVYLIHLRRILRVQPNAAHIVLVKFSLSVFRETIAPGSTFTLITQNVDGLSTRVLALVKSNLGDTDIGGV
jgi:NAD-dependent deacetylase sirtuin 5